jgi:hypothetical protein
MQTGLAQLPNAPRFSPSIMRVAGVLRSESFTLSPDGQIAFLSSQNLVDLGQFRLGEIKVI